MILAKNNFVWVTRYEPQTKMGDFVIPDAAQKKNHFGKIISVGLMVADKSIVVGETAVFNKQVGQDILVDGVEYTVLRAEDQILGCLPE